MAENKGNDLHKGHRERMRLKFESKGFQGWHKHEVLEFMLYHVFKQGNTNEIAHKILNYSAKSMKQMFENAKDDRLEAISGVSGKTIGFLRHLGAFIEYYETEKLIEDSVVLSRNNIREIIGIADMSDEHEDIVMICLDGRMRIKSMEKITDSSDSVSATADIDTIVRNAARVKAANVVIVHNHPSGSEEISDEDRRMTDFLDNKLRAIDIFLVDHYIVCGDKIVSIKMTSKRRKIPEVHDGGK